MKKFIYLLAPLMAISLLANCGGTSTTCTVTFDAGNGKFFGGASKASFELKKGAKILPFIKGLIPALDDNTFAYYACDDGTGFDYDDVVTSDITIKAHYFKTADLPYKDLTNFDWETIRNVAVTNEHPENCFKLGATKTITVNKQPHLVRIIGFNHDELSSSTETNPLTAGITFEFVNLLSDEDGYSLATPWESEAGGNSKNYNYLNSNLRKAFDGNAETSIFWARKGQSSEATEEPYYHKTVLDMLPTDLKKVLKEVRKEVTVYNTDKNEYEVNKTDYNTTIFPLSYAETCEVASEEVLTEGSIYEFYKPDESNEESKRIKYQVKWHDGAIKYDQRPIIDSRGINSAGYNNETDEYGGFYWLRSPKVKGNNFSISVYQGYHDGDLSEIICHSSLLAIAPAFCV